MNPALYQRAAEIFSQACDLSPQTRAAYIARECGEDAQLLSAVNGMLAGDQESLQLTASRGVRAGLEQLVGSSDDSAAYSPGVHLPERIGPYIVLRHIGRGGMGDVFECRQENPDRSVAIKLMRSGIDSPAMFRRFRREVEFLGRLAHPGIAQIFDAGVADIGASRVPYFAMEYVHGRTLTDYVKANDLSLAQRLALVASICDIVQFAHQQGVIHRDLKPGNILITEVTGDSAGTRVTSSSTIPSSLNIASSLTGPALPRILDFGIARMTEETPQSGTFVTEAGQMVGTLGFMSPEQVRNEPGKVDTRSDIYALGVILYLLLSGRLPHRIEGKNALDAARQVLEGDPPRLGTLVPACRGDIETIVATAMHKDKDRRYSSAAQLAMDLRRYLANEPISARPATASYLIRKFAARHKGLVTAAAAIALLSVSSGITIGVLYQREQQQRARAEIAQAAAEREAQQQRETVSFLVYDTFGAAAPSKKGPSLRVVEVLDQAASGVDERFKNDPGLRGSVRAIIANLFFASGQNEKAQTAIALAVEELQAGGLSYSKMAIEATLLHANVQMALARYQRAEELFNDTLRLCDLAPAQARDSRMKATVGLAEALQQQGKHAQAEPLLRQCIESANPSTTEQWVAAISARLSLAASLREQNRSDEIGQLLKDAADLGRKNLGDTHPAVLAAMNNYAGFLLQSGRSLEAAPIALAVFAAVEKSYPPGHANVGFAATTAARALVMAGQTQEAKALAVRGLDIFRKMYDDADFNVERAAGSVVKVYQQAKDPAGVLPHFKIYLWARLLAAGAGEGEGVKARTTELSELLATQPGKTLEDIGPDLLAFIEECRTMPLITKAGGLQSSPHAARLLANLARALHSTNLPDRVPRSQQLLEEARASLSVSVRREEDSALIEAVAKELSGGG